MPEPRSESGQYNKIFIGGLTYNTTDEMLKEYYEQWGEVVDCIVMRDAATKRSRGFGFVTYAEQVSVDQAMSNRPHIIDGKTVEPKRAIPRDMSGKPETNMSVKKLYVSGVREEHTDEMFRDYFSQFGPVTEVDIITDKATGKKRGFAFVSFDDYDPVDKCVLQKSHMIDNKRCDVKKALSKEEIKKAEQQSRDRQERDMRSRGTSRGSGGGGNASSGGGGGGGDWMNGGYGGASSGGSYGGGWNQGSGGGQWNQGGGSWGPSSGGAGGWGGQGAGNQPGYGGGYGSGGYQGGYGAGTGASAGGAAAATGYQGGWSGQGGWSAQPSSWGQGSNVPAAAQPPAAGGWSQTPQGWQGQGGGWSQGGGGGGNTAAAGGGGGGSWNARR